MTNSNSPQPVRGRRVRQILEELDLPEIEGDEFAPALPTLESDLGMDSAYENFSIESYDN